MKCGVRRLGVGKSWGLGVGGPSEAEGQQI